MIYTEEMKREIESHGIMVIEFKMMIKKGKAAITIIADKIALAFDGIIGAIKNFLNSFMQLVEERVVAIFKPIVDKFLKHYVVAETKHQFIKNIKSGHRLIIKRPIIICWSENG